MKNPHSPELSPHVPPPNASPTPPVPEAPLSGRTDIQWGRMGLALLWSVLIIGMALVAEALL